MWNPFDRSDERERQIKRRKLAGLLREYRAWARTGEMKRRVAYVWSVLSFMIVFPIVHFIFEGEWELERLFVGLYFGIFVTVYTEVQNRKLPSRIRRLRGTLRELERTASRVAGGASA